MPVRDVIKNENYYKTYKFLLKSQYFSREELDQLINKKIKLLVEYIEKHNPFYQRLIKKNSFSSKDINNFYDLKRYFPILTKSDLLKHLSEILSNESFKLRTSIVYTSGSTGKQAKLIRDLNTAIWSWASIYRYYNWIGIQLGEKEVDLWGRLDFIKKPTIKSKISEFVSRKRKLSAYEMSEDKMATYAKFIQKYKPSLLRGYASAINHFASFIDENNISLPPIKAISTTADMLTENMRNCIEKVFGCGVFNQYACGEVLGGAQECECKNGIHIAEEHNLYEVDAPEGEIGDIIITDLDNYAMPIVRYKNGDKGIMDSGICKCGRNTKRIKQIIGRNEEFIKLKDGRELNTTFFSPIFSKFKTIKQFQIIQSSIDKIIIRMIIDKDKCEQKLIEKAFNTIIGQVAKINFSYVNNILDKGEEKYKVIVRKF